MLTYCITDRLALTPQSFGCLFLIFLVLLAVQLLCDSTSLIPPARIPFSFNRALSVLSGCSWISMFQSSALTREVV